MNVYGKSLSEPHRHGKRSSSTLITHRVVSPELSWPPAIIEPVKYMVDASDFEEPIAINFMGGLVEIDFGDGSAIATYVDSVVHTYAPSTEPCIITITPKSYVNSISSDAKTLLEWGSSGSVGHFRFLHPAPTVPTYLPKWLTDLSDMFNNCQGFSQDLSEWDVSRVTNMSNMFKRAHNLSGDLNQWDVSSVTNMQGMVIECHGNISTLEDWNVSNVEDMSHMFDTASCAGNINLTKWDISSVKDTSYMFNNCYTFNSNLSQWMTSNVTNMAYMFNECYALFDEDTAVGNWSMERWDVSNVTNMEHMFYSCFNGVSSNITRWKTGNVVSMKNMFSKCYHMNHLTFWDTGKVVDMSGMFDGSYSFDSDLSNWDVSNVLYMDNMFRGCNWFVASLENWNVANIPSEPAGIFDDLRFMPEMNKPKWGYVHRI